MNKQFRFIINGEAGIWWDYDSIAFLRHCDAYAENEQAFAVEFRAVELED